LGKLGNLNVLIGNWKDIKKITITAESMVKYNNDKVGKKQTLGSVEFRLTTIYIIEINK
jgi:hypothetical protein